MSSLAQATPGIAPPPGGYFAWGHSFDHRPICKKKVVNLRLRPIQSTAQFNGRWQPFRLNVEIYRRSRPVAKFGAKVAERKVFHDQFQFWLFRLALL